MTIDELNALTTLTAEDEVPVWDSEESGEPTKKITASNLAASVKSLADLPNTTEMNDAIQQSTADVVYTKIYTYSYDAPTANVAFAIATIANIIPSGATYVGALLICAYGNADTDIGTVFGDHLGLLYYMPKKSQDTITLRYAVYYKM